MDLTNKTNRFPPAIVLAIIVAAYPGAGVHAGAKIFKTTDSQGNVTFTDVPLLLAPSRPETRNQQDLQDLKKLQSPPQSKQWRQRGCESHSTYATERCPHESRRM